MKKLLVQNRYIIILATLFTLGQINMTNADDETKNIDIHTGKYEKATFAGGCFWCMQPPFDKLNGVISTEVGYAGGFTENPTYKEVCSDTTGHAEAIEIVFDPSRISYAELLDVFWRNIDPATINAQFADRGTQYRTAIFYHSEEQKRIADTSKAKLENSGKIKKPIVTEITPAVTFYRAEEYHQKYYQKSPYRYNAYKYGSGRDKQLEKIWEKGLKE